MIPDSSEQEPQTPESEPQSIVGNQEKNWTEGDLTDQANQAAQELAAVLHPRNPRFRSTIKDLAISLKTYLRQAGQQPSIAVGSFTGQPQLPDPHRCGHRIMSSITAELSALGVVCTRKAEYSCKGDFGFDPDSSSVIVFVRVFDDSNREVQAVEQTIELEETTSLVEFFNDL